MTRSARVIVLSVLCGFSTSVLLLLLYAFDQGPWHRVIRALTTKAGFLEFGFLLFVAVLPASLPMTIVGGWLAARLMARQQDRRLGSWIVRGCAAGFCLGALGSALWFGGINASYMWDASWNDPPAGWVGDGRREMLAFILKMASVGGIAGIPVGCIVAAFCWRITRELPPNDALQLTRPG
jgi:hypothetical protein